MTVTAPTLEEMTRARRALEDVVVHTPLVPLRDSSGRFERPRIFLKPEILQPVTSFKIRGVFWAVASLPEEERRAGVSTVSAGNTAQALAWAARHFGVPARCLMPEGAPSPKIDMVRALGGEPVLVSTQEVFRFLREHLWTRDEPWASTAFVHPWTDRAVATGHASLGLEIADDLPAVDRVYVSVGGGGMLAGLGSALRARCPEARIVAVEPTGCPALTTALDRGRPVEVECRTICDGIAVPYITEEMFPLLRDLVDETVLVEEDDTRAAMGLLARRHKMIVEPSGAITVAAALSCSGEADGESVCILSGGSVSDALLAEVVLASGP